MTSTEQRGGDIRAQYAPEVVELIKNEAIKMSQEHDVIEVKVGHTDKGGSIWVSRDQQKIIDPEKVTVDGVDYYFGLFTKGV